MILAGIIVAKVTMVSSMAVDYKMFGATSVFSINHVGEIRLLRSIDREIRSSYTVGVLALTRTNPPLATLAEFTIRVTDINDNVPRFHSDNYTIALVENTMEAKSIFKGKNLVYFLHEQSSFILALNNDLAFG